MSTVTVTQYGSNIACFGAWSHNGETFTLGWDPSDGDVIELLALPGIEPYRDGKEDVFEGCPQHVATLCQRVVEEGVNIILCKMMVTRAAQNKDAEGMRVWSTLAQIHEEAYAREVQKARRRHSREGRGSGSNHMRVVFP